MAKSITKTWDHYVKEATKPAFNLKVSDDKTIVVEAPTGGQLLDAQEMAISGRGTAADQLRIICGDEVGEEIVDLVRAAPGGAMDALVRDIMTHFGYDLGEADSRT